MFYCWYCKYKRYKYMYMLFINVIIINCDISVYVLWVIELKNKNLKKILIIFGVYILNVVFFIKYRNLNNFFLYDSV